MAARKIKCSYKECKDGAQRIAGDCGFCNGHFCGRHRLLEDHKCTGLEDVSFPFPYFPLISFVEIRPFPSAAASHRWPYLDSSLSITPRNWPLTLIVNSL